MTLKELMQKFVNNEITLETKIKIIFPEEWIERDRIMSLKNFIEKPWLSFEKYTFEIIKQKKKIYRHIYICKEEVESFKSDKYAFCKVTDIVSSHNWDSINHGKHLFLLKTEEIEV